MNFSSHDLLFNLCRTTLALAVAILLMATLLRLARVTSPTVHRVACALALAVGWSFLQWPVNVPWYQPEVVAESADVPLAGEPIELPHVDLDEPIEAVTDIDLEVLPHDPAAQGDDHLSAAAMPTSDEGAFRTSKVVYPFALGAWGLGMVAVALAWGVGYLRFVRQLPPAVPGEDSWQREWHDLLAARGVQGAIPLRVTASAGPMLCRLPGAYELLIPEPLWREMNTAERLAILRHELAHYERCDVWKSLAIRVLALPHWFNPLAWYAVRRFDEAAEWACDRAATGDLQTTAYARALLRLGEISRRQAAYSPAAHGPPLAARIRRLLATRTGEDSRAKKSLLIVACIGFALAALVRVELVAREPVASQEPVVATSREGTEPTADEPAGKALLTSKAPPPGTPPGTGEAEVLTENVSPRYPAVIQAAADGFSAARAEYESGTNTLHLVCEWSLRWLAEEEAAERIVTTVRKVGTENVEEMSRRMPTDAERIIAVQAHLDRMKQLQGRVDELHRLGAQGGEAEKKALMAYYVADAERRLSRLEKHLAVDQRDAAILKNVPKLAGVNARDFSDRIARHPELLGVADTAEAAQADPRSALQYEGRTCAEWLVDIDTELSPERRRAAIPALAAFGMRGYGPEATKKLVELLADEELRPTAIRALGKIGPPAAEALPALEELAKWSGDDPAPRQAMARIRGEREVPAGDRTATERARREQKLREVIEQKSQELIRDMKEVENLEKVLGVVDPAQAAVQQSVLQQQLMLLRQAALNHTSQMGSLDTEIEGMKLEIALAKDPLAADARFKEFADADDKVRKLQDQVDVVEEALGDTASAGGKSEYLTKRRDMLLTRLNQRMVELKKQFSESKELLRMKEIQGRLTSVERHRERLKQQLEELQKQQRELTAALKSTGGDTAEVETKRQKIRTQQQIVDELNRELHKLQLERQGIGDPATATEPRS